MTHPILRLAILAATAASSACLDLALMAALEPDASRCGSSTCAMYHIDSWNGVRFLNGDTLRLRIWSHEPYRLSHWTADGAVRLAYGDTLLSTSRRPDSVVVIRGAGRGFGTVQARSAAAPDLIRSVEMTVVDSVEIREIRVWGSPVLRPGDSTSIGTLLRDGTFPVEGRPTAWSLSDSTKGTVVHHVVHVSLGRPLVQTFFRAGQDTGRVFVRAHFLSLRDSIAVRIQR